MSRDDWKTLRVPVEAWEQAKAQKEAEGRTWGEQIVRPDDGDSDDNLADHIEKVLESVDKLPERTADELEARRR